MKASPAGPVRRVRRACGLFAVLALPASLAAQTVTTGAVEVRVAGADGEPIAGALVRLGGTLATTPLRTGPGGSARFRLLPAGIYEVHVETLGYRPAVVRGLNVAEGALRSIETRLTPAAPPVLSVDTFEAAPPPPGSAGRSFAGPFLHALPDLERDLAELAALDSRFDEELGGEGLPGEHTGVFADGVPFAAAAHPWVRGRAGAGLPFPRASLRQVRIVPAPVDVEWSGFAGPLVSAATGRADGEALGLWSGTPLWSGDVSQPPALTSWWAAGAARVALVPDTSFLAVALDARRLQLPAFAPGSDSLAALLAGTDGLPAGTASRIAEPFVRERTSLAGSARLDWRLTPTSLVLARASLARLDGGVADGEALAEPWRARALQPSASGTDFSAMTQLLTDLKPTLTLEFRGGFSRSSREFGPAGSAALPPTRLVESAAELGLEAGTPAEVARQELQATLGLHWRRPGSWVKLGGQVSRLGYEHLHLPAPDGLFVLAGPTADGATRGSYFLTPGPGSTTDVGVTEVGGFLQLHAEVVPGFEVSAGARLDRELLPIDDLRPDAGWVTASGLLPVPDPALDKLTGRFGFSWDVTARGTTFLDGSVGVHFGRMSGALLAEAMAPPVETLLLTGVTSWPAAPAGTGTAGSRLALLPEELQAPRTVRGRITLAQRIARGTRLSVGGAFRRTEYLMRRRDLNRVAFPAFRAEDGRPVYGTPSADGALLLAEPGSNRRFAAFETVWGLVPDGTSDYRALDLLLEHDRPGWTVVAGYTLSNTTDDLWGAADPRPEASLPPAVTPAGEASWQEGPSDFDVRHRAVAAFRAELPLPAGGALSGAYRYRSGLPFTPGFRGVDANLDGSALNDPAFVPAGEAAAAALARHGCAPGPAGSILERNACRTAGAHRLDLRAAIGLARVGSRTLEIVVDGLNLTGGGDAGVDPALLLLDPEGEVRPDGDVLRVPYRLNPAFGEAARSGGTGRVLRLGLRLGGGS